jgi:hypothetical protein
VSEQDETPAAEAGQDVYAQAGLAGAQGSVPDDREPAAADGEDGEEGEARP